MEGPASTLRRVFFNQCPVVAERRIRQRVLARQGYAYAGWPTKDVELLVDAGRWGSLAGGMLYIQRWHAAALRIRLQSMGQHWSWNTPTVFARTTKLYKQYPDLLQKNRYIPQVYSGLCEVEGAICLWAGTGFVAVHVAI